MWWYALNRAGSVWSVGRAGVDVLRREEEEEAGGSVGRCHSGTEEREDWWYGTWTK